MIFFIYTSVEVFPYLYKNIHSDSDVGKIKWDGWTLKKVDHFKGTEHYW